MTRLKTALKAQIDTAILISPQNLPSDALNVTLGVAAAWDRQGPTEIERTGA
jgi:hypothetical protein